MNKVKEYREKLDIEITVMAKELKLTLEEYLNKENKRNTFLDYEIVKILEIFKSKDPLIKISDLFFITE